MKLEHTLSIHQQQALVDEIIISAVKQGIIKDGNMVSRPDMVHHLVVCLGEAAYPRKKIVMFREGIITPAGNAAFVVLNEKDSEGKYKEVKTSIPQTPYTEGVDELTWFETINTIYVMAPGGQPVEDLRGRTIAKSED